MKLTVVGSCDFVKDMKKISGYLTTKGHELLLPTPLVTEEQYAKEHGREKLLKDKAFFTKKHCKKIENSDALLVINPKKRNIEGYIGSNTLMEIAVAFYFEKPIFFLNNFNENHPHYEELVGLNAIILNNNLDLIK